MGWAIGVLQSSARWSRTTVVLYAPCAVAENVTVGDALVIDEEPSTRDAMMALIFMTVSLLRWLRAGIMQRRCHLQVMEISWETTSTSLRDPQRSLRHPQRWRRSLHGIATPTLTITT